MKPCPHGQSPQECALCLGLQAYLEGHSLPENGQPLVEDRTVRMIDTSYGPVEVHHAPFNPLK